jgi:predicted branched-subunit amino acid permease
MAAAMFFAAVVSASPLVAQRTDTVTMTAAATRPPLTPRRAFFYSFIAPGYSQTRLGRHKAAAAFMLTEAISIAMIRESASNVAEARRIENDTLIVSYVDPSGLPVIISSPPLFGDRDVRARRAHLEDWAALLVANHLFAGADGFVAAHLWDVPTRLSLRAWPRGGGAVVSANFKW